MSIQRWIDEVYQNAIDHGFYTDWTNISKCVRDNEDQESIKDIGAVVDMFVAQKISLIHSELSEALEAWRKRKKSDFVNGRDSFELEIADTIIRIFDLCGFLEIDIEKRMIWKHNYNKKREYKHGKAF